MNQKVDIKFDWLYNKSDKEITTKISEIYSNQFVENYSLIRLKEIFADSKKLKKELLSNLTAYFKWSYNNESSAIDNNLLNKFGLECCNKCKKN